MYKLLLCQRYLRTRYIALASIISVTLGVATMIVVNSVMAGFSTQMRERIHGILADVVIEATNADGAPDPERITAQIMAAVGDDVEAISPTVEIYGMLTFKYLGQYVTRPVTIVGIDPETKSTVGTLTTSLENYQDIVDDGKVLRKAERQPSQKPDWNLSPAFADYRRRMVDQRQMLETGPVPDREPEATLEPDEPTDAAHGLEMASEPENPFDNIVDAQVAPMDPAAPQVTRCYIGAGLIRFPIKDNDTGKTRMVSMVMPGDDITLSTVTAGQPPNPVHFEATVVDVFKSGMSEYDSQLVFVNLEQLQKWRVMIDPQTGMRSITTVQIRLKDYKKSKAVVEKLRGAFPPGMFSVRTWEQKQGPLLAAVAVETSILNVLLFLIIAVAGFGILAIFFMIVVEKTRDIGILKALGAHSNGVMSIFLSYGLALGIVGSGVGVVLGLLFVWRINDIEHWLTKLTGIEVFDERIYYFPEIPTHVEPFMVAWVAGGAVLIAVLASILPARRASRLHPVQALRYE